MVRFTRAALVMSAALVLVACDDGEEAETEMPETAESVAPQPDGSMGAMGSMNAPATYVMGDMTTHMQRVGGVGMDSIGVLMPMHLQRVDTMVVQMHRDMASRDMAADPQWDAIADSIRTDATRMSGMTATELQIFMPQHSVRVLRMMDMHRTMMSGEPG